MPKLVWAIRIRYLSEVDNKWHQHITKWYANSEDAWKESDTFLNHANALESSCSLIRTEAK